MKDELQSYRERIPFLVETKLISQVQGSQIGSNLYFINKRFIKKLSLKLFFIY